MSIETKAKNIMSTRLITIPPTTKVEDALKVLVNNKITGIPVVNSSGKLIGVLSELDIISQIMKNEKIKSKDFSAEIAYSKKVASVTDSTSLDKVLKVFTDTKYRRLPVVNSTGKLVGIITRRDIMRLLFYRARMGD